MVPQHRAGVMLGAGEVLVDIEPEVGATGAGAGDRARGVDLAGTLLQGTVSEVAGAVDRRVGRVHQLALHLVGGQRRVIVEHQSDDARRHRRRLRGPRHHEVVADLLEHRVGLGEVGDQRHQAEHVAAGSHHIGLDEGLEGRPGGGPRGQVVVARIVGGEGVGEGADGDHVGHVAGYPDRHRLGPAVAGRGHHHDAGLPGRHHRLGQGIVPVPRQGLGADREVHHLDAVGRLVGHQPVDAADDVGVGAGAVGQESLDRHQVGRRGDAVVLALGGDAARQHDARHVGTMAAVVGVAAHRIELVVDGVILGEHPRLTVGVVVEIREGPVAGVDHRHRDTGAVDALGVELIGAGKGRIVGFRDQGALDLDVVDVEVAADLFRVSARDQEANLGVGRQGDEILESEGSALLRRVVGVERVARQLSPGGAAVPRGLDPRYDRAAAAVAPIAEGEGRAGHSGEVRPALGAPIADGSVVVEKGAEPQTVPGRAPGRRTYPGKSDAGTVRFAHLLPGADPADGPVVAAERDRVEFVPHGVGDRRGVRHVDLDVVEMQLLAVVADVTEANPGVGRHVRGEIEVLDVVGLDVGRIGLERRPGLASVARDLDRGRGQAAERFVSIGVAEGGRRGAGEVHLAAQGMTLVGLKEHAIRVDPRRGAFRNADDGDRAGHRIRVLGIVVDPAGAPAAGAVAATPGDGAELVAESRGARRGVQGAVVVDPGDAGGRGEPIAPRRVDPCRHRADDTEAVGDLAADRAHRLGSGVEIAALDDQADRRCRLRRWCAGHEQHCQHRQHCPSEDRWDGRFHGSTSVPVLARPTLLARPMSQLRHHRWFLPPDEVSAVHSVRAAIG